MGKCQSVSISTSSTQGAVCSRAATERSSDWGAGCMWRHVGSWVPIKLDRTPSLRHQSNPFPDPTVMKVIKKKMRPVKAARNFYNRLWIGVKKTRWGVKKQGALMNSNGYSIWYLSMDPFLILRQLLVREILSENGLKAEVWRFRSWKGSQYNLWTIYHQTFQVPKIELLTYISCMYLNPLENLPHQLVQFFVVKQYDDFVASRILGLKKEHV